MLALLRRAAEQASISVPVSRTPVQTGRTRRTESVERQQLSDPLGYVRNPLELPDHGRGYRGVEIDSVVADGVQSVILKQVTFGIAVRMAVMSMVAMA